MSDPVPLDLAAAESNLVSYLFYVRAEDNTIAQLKSQTPIEVQQNGQGYVQDLIQIHNKPVKTHPAVKKVTAVTYAMGGNKEIRLYYVDKDLNLHELCKTNDQPWKDGSVGDTAIFPACEQTALSCTIAQVGESLKQLKVFFNGKNSQMWVAYTELGKGDWTSRSINKGNIIY
ncbi:hypothetical protein MMC17_000236 [Xylographa soralifera]|nr:hypothetical protein [Xylographa soralifera]